MSEQDGYTRFLVMDDCSLPATQRDARLAW